MTAGTESLPHWIASDTRFGDQVVELSIGNFAILTVVPISNLDALRDDINHIVMHIASCRYCC